MSEWQSRRMRFTTRFTRQVHAPASQSPARGGEYQNPWSLSAALPAAHAATDEERPLQKPPIPALPRNKDVFSRPTCVVQGRVVGGNLPFSQLHT